MERFGLTAVDAGLCPSAAASRSHVGVISRAAFSGAGRKFNCLKTRIARV